MPFGPLRQEIVPTFQTPQNSNEEITHIVHSGSLRQSRNIEHLRKTYFLNADFFFAKKASHLKEPLKMSILPLKHGLRSQYLGRSCLHWIPFPWYPTGHGPHLVQKKKYPHLTFFEHFEKKHYV